MKFNEKLIELRKKEGLSQEELGYKLNVTRQTVSKWELGQTTPEMDKLVEIGKIFNISVDELTNDSEITTNANPTIEDRPIVENKGKNNKIVLIIVVALLIVFIFIIIKTFTAFSIFNKVTDEATNAQGSFFDKFFSLFDKALDTQENMFNQITDSQGNIFDQAENIIENTTSKMNVTKFNGVLELYNGSNVGTSLKKLLDEVITINKTEDRKIAVKYNEINTQDVEEIKDLKMSFDDSNNFEVSFEYDEDGYIYEVEIERVVSKFEISKFNNSLEIYAGTTMGGSVIRVIDTIITSNKTEERKITVKYLENETQNEDEIKNIKREIGTFNNYEITFEYDAEGFINKAIIEKL